MICCVQLYYKVEAKDGTISLTRITSQENPAVEIIHFGRTGLNGLCPNKFFILNRGRLLEGEKWLVYWCMPAILHSVSFLFSLCFVTLILSHSFLFFLNVYSCGVMVMVVLWFSPSDCYCSHDDTMHDKGPLYIAWCDWFYYFSL